MDARVIRTQRDLSAALLSLLEEKEYDSIKVIDICNRALISKVTFYNNFKNKEELLIHILMNFEQKVIDDINNHPLQEDKNKTSIIVIVTCAYKKVIEYKKMFQKLLENKESATVILELRNFIYREIIKNYDALVLDKKKLVPKEAFAAFYSGAIISLLPKILEITDSEDGIKQGESIVEALLN